MTDRYGRDVLAAGRPSRKPQVPDVVADMGVVVEDAATEFCGAVVGFDKAYDGWYVRLDNGRGAVRTFAMRPAAFLVDGSPVTLVRPRMQSASPTRTASGSRIAPTARARTARASRIFVEGVHDAALVEKIWGDDLRSEGVVVTSLDGLDNLAEVLADFGPAPHRRAGVLVDHLVAHSKETQLTQGLGPHVLITGHPFVDVWQAVKPSVMGIAAWPTIPMGIDWKTGICDQLGWGSPRAGWQRIFGAVNDFRDVETPLINAVEQLIDFVTAATDDQ